MNAPVYDDYLISEQTNLLQPRKKLSRRNRLTITTIIVFIFLLIASHLFIPIFNEDKLLPKIAGGSSSLYQKSSDVPPHIIMLYVDDLGYHDVGWAKGDFEGLSPTIDSLREKSIELRAYYGQSLCTPSRAALMTGRYPFKTGMQYDIIEPDVDWGLPVQFRILPQYLSDAGYKSYAIGKWHLGHFSKEFLPHNRGFEEFYGYLGAAENYYSHKDHNGYLDFTDTQNFGKTNMSFNCVHEDGVYGPTLHTNRALEIIDRWKRGSEKPSVFLYMAYQLVHSPLQTSTDTDFSSVQHILDRFNYGKRSLFGMQLFQLDFEIKKLMDGLTEAGMLENAIIIFASDNGGCYSKGSSNYPFRGSKGYLYEGGTHVRSFIHSPKYLPSEKRNRNYDGLFHVTDWLPTMMDAIIPGWSADPQYGANLGLDGLSHWEPLRAGLSESDVRTELVYNIRPVFNPTDQYHGDTLDPRAAIRVGDWKYILNEACQVWGDYHGRYDDYRFKSQCEHEESGCTGLYPVSRKTFLFNIKDDPFETTDLSSEYPDIATQLHNRILELKEGEMRSKWKLSNGYEHHQAVTSWNERGCISPWKTR